MFLRIIKDNDDEIGYSLNKYEISEVDKKLSLKFYTNEEIIQYTISKDDRESDLSLIKEFISQQLDKAFSNKKPFTISEELERQYIWIGDDDEKKFTIFIK